jgi:hypothetical protein
MAEVVLPSGPCVRLWCTDRRSSGIVEGVDGMIRIWKRDAATPACELLVLLETVSMAALLCCDRGSHLEFPWKLQIWKLYVSYRTCVNLQILLRSRLAAYIFYLYASYWRYYSYWTGSQIEIPCRLHMCNRRHKYWWVRDRLHICEQVCSGV